MKFIKDAANEKLFFKDFGLIFLLHFINKLNLNY
jgi:hypothetical protein